MPTLIAKSLFVAAAIYAVSPWCEPWMALVIGMALALSISNPFPQLGSKTAKILLQCCVVLLGFKMNLREVLDAGRTGIAFAAVSIAATLALGCWLGRLLAIGGKTSALISSGTAICGGSAIAAVGSVIGVAPGEIAVATGCVFLLNAVALLLFPVLGHALHLTQEQFGLWAGIAIHDISSVAGAGSTYGAQALQVATAVKLSRVLWIIPLVLLMSVPRVVALYAGTAAAAPGGRVRVQLPWFIGLFLAASCVHSFVGGIAAAEPAILRAARSGFALTLLLIGAGLSRKTVATVGWRAMVQGVALWVFISTTSLLVVRHM